VIPAILQQLDPLLRIMIVTSITDITNREQ
jgi:hypothetical protein